MRIYKGNPELVFRGRVAPWYGVLSGVVAAAAAVLALRAWVGEWTAMDAWQLRVGWLLLIVAAGAVTYAVAMFASGLRPRHLRL